MSILQRYIGLSVIKLTLIVLCIVLGMEFFITLVGQIGDMGHGHYGLLQALWFAVLSLPNNLYQLFPMIGLLGSLIALGSLGAGSELVVMRAAGVSVGQIITIVLKTALLLVIIITVLGEGVAPYTQAMANKEKLLAESAGQATATAQGIWVKNGNDFINIQTVMPDLHLQGVTEYRFNDHQQLQQAFYAKTADKLNGQWVLNDINVTEFAKGKIASRFIKQTKWDVDMNTKLLGGSKSHAAEMSIWNLYHYIQYRKANGLITSTFSLDFWQRLLQPIATLIMIFLSIPFVFGPLRSVTMGVRIVTGAVVGFVFYLLNQFFGPIGLVYQVPPVIGAGLPIVLFACLAIWLMRRVR